MPTLINPHAFPPGTMLSAVQRLGLSSGLKLCLDASDVNSYSGAGQSWLDTSGNGYDFFRGTTSGAQASDPTFNGSAGGQSSAEYWGFDGGDHFTYDSANETWMNNLHKNSAVWAFAAWIYVAGDPAAGAALFGNNNGDNEYIGVASFLRTDGTLRVGVTRGVEGSDVLVITSTDDVNENAWNFLAGQVSEAAGTGFLQVNAAQEDETTTYSAPTSSNASETTQVAWWGSQFPDFGRFPSGYRYASLAMWESAAPTKAEMLSLYNLTKAKFGH